MSTLRVSLLQANTHWHNPAKSRLNLEALLQQAAPGTQLLVLPEMFATGFTMDTRQAEDHLGDSCQWMLEVSRQRNALVLGSLATRDADGSCRNRLYAAFPDGTMKWADKRHLFRLAGEQEHYQAGDGKLMLEWQGWRILGLVCYDLRFPVWSRNRLPDHPEAYDLLVYVANWPQRRQLAWERLLPARAVENQAFCLGVNRVGHDGNDYPYTGCSMACNLLGEVLGQLGPTEAVLNLSMDLEEQLRLREKLAFWMDADHFALLPNPDRR